MLKRGRPAAPTSTRERSWMPQSHSPIIAAILLTRTSAAVGLVQRAARIIARGDDGKHHRAQKRLELIVERAIDEDGLGGRWLRPGPSRHATARTSSAGRR